jgi:hypothetical protein
MAEVCEECHRLWNWFTDVTYELAAAEGRMKMAALRNEHDAVQRIVPEMQAAAERKADILRQILHHEEAVHPRAAA